MKCIPIIRSELKNHGITEGISEMIVTTGFEHPNAAPIGIIWKNDRLFLRLFKGSRTYRNLEHENFFAGNITSNPLVYVRSAFTDLSRSNFVYISFEIPDASDPENVKQVDVPVLSNGDGFVIFQCMQRKYSENALFIDVCPVCSKMTARSAFGTFINRGFNSVIDATVHLTRYRETHDPKYIELIRYHQGIIQRCGRPEDKEALLFLKKKLIEFSEETL